MGGGEDGEMEDGEMEDGEMEDGEMEEEEGFATGLKPGAGGGAGGAGGDGGGGGGVGNGGGCRMKQHVEESKPGSVSFQEADALLHQL